MIPVQCTDAPAYAAIKTGTDISKEAEVEKLMNSINFETIFVDGQQQNLYNGVRMSCHTSEHRRYQKLLQTSPRIHVYAISWQTCSEKPHITTILFLTAGISAHMFFPTLIIRFFLTADVKERAKRRYIENIEKGVSQPFEQVLDEMIQRDYNDSHRKLAPLKQADDAILIDTTYLSIKQTEEKLLGYINQENK